MKYLIVVALLLSACNVNDKVQRFQFTDEIRKNCDSFGGPYSISTNTYYVQGKYTVRYKITCTDGKEVEGRTEFLYKD